MKNITSNQRTLNILAKAIENGFEFDENDRLEDVRIQAEEFLIENTEAVEEECEVNSIGRGEQRVDWSDNMGFEFWSQGEIINFKDYWFDTPETKVYHNTVVNSEGQVVKLYYLVGETDHNKELNNI